MISEISYREIERKFVKTREVELKKPFSEPLQVKDAILFAAKDKEQLIDILQLDTYEPPLTQVIITNRLKINYLLYFLI